MKDINKHINEGFGKNVKVNLRDFQTSGIVLHKEYPHVSTEHAIEVLSDMEEPYLDDNELCMSDITVAKMWDDGTLQFPKGFSKNLAITIRNNYIKAMNLDINDHLIMIGPSSKPDYDEYKD